MVLDRLSSLVAPTSDLKIKSSRTTQPLGNNTSSINHYLLHIFPYSALLTKLSSTGPLLYQIRLRVLQTSHFRSVAFFVQLSGPVDMVVLFRHLLDLVPRIGQRIGRIV